MRPLALKAEPAGFNVNVRIPGKNFLARNPRPSSQHFKKKSFWKACANDLNAAYDRICAYTGFYLATPGSVDHFMPKTLHPNLAYEWSNYRLAMPRVNSHKGNSTDVIDPFVVQNNWFILDFPSCLVKPGAGLSAAIQAQVLKTIQVLKLNDDDVFVQERCDIMLSYARNEINLDFLSRRYPFLAYEINRQGLTGSAAAVFKTRATI